MGKDVNVPKIKIAYLKGETRKHARACDKNNNGVIDGNEIKLFKQRTEIPGDNSQYDIRLYDDNHNILEGTTIRKNGNTTIVNYGAASVPGEDFDIEKTILYDKNDVPRAEFSTEGKMKVKDVNGKNIFSCNLRSGEIEE